MSTNYYELRKPFTSIKFTRRKVHSEIDLWANGAHVGRLKFRVDSNEDTDAIWMMFETGSPVIRRVLDCRAGGPMYIISREPGSQVLMDEYGALHAYAAMRVLEDIPWMNADEYERICFQEDTA